MRARGERRVVHLDTGTLELTVRRAELELDALLGFAARENARRSFLFVSKVLGKHYPVRPSHMSAVHAKLAARVDPAPPGPILLIALAETAVGLGQSVYEHYRKATGREDTLFLHSTRYRVGPGPWLSFSESHSHAPRHYLHEPAEPDDRSLFRAARSLVVVDDEASTGNTFVETVRAYSAINPHLRSATLATLTDWLEPEQRARIRADLGLETSFASLLEGSFSFTPEPGVHAPHAPRSYGERIHDLPLDHGRRGRRELPALPELSGLLPARLLGPPAKVLVLGTGEFLYLPFKLACRLEAMGHEVNFQSTTRSPIRLGADIRTKLELVDNYSEGIPNFVYNVRRGAQDLVLVCYETSRLPEDHRLSETLDGTALFFR